MGAQAGRVGRQRVPAGGFHDVVLAAVEGLLGALDEVLAQCRTFSKVLALQIKAREVDLPTPVYGLQEVHHLA
jgi:hypothetical protein